MRDKRSHPQAPIYGPGGAGGGSILTQLQQLQGTLSIGWSQLTSVPTTVAGFGITDAYTDAEVDALLADYYTSAQVDTLLAALDASDIGPGTFPTGAGKYVVEPSTTFNTSMEIQTSADAPWGFSIRGYDTGATNWVAGFLIQDLSGDNYASFAKASGANDHIYLQSYKGGMFYLARMGNIEFAPGGTTTKWTMDKTSFDLVAASGAMARLAASTTAKATLRVPHGTAPTSPTNGDMWTTTAGLFVRINGATVGPLS